MPASLLEFFPSLCINHILLFWTEMMTESTYIFSWAMGHSCSVCPRTLRGLCCVFYLFGYSLEAWVWCLHACLCPSASSLTIPSLPQTYVTSPADHRDPQKPEQSHS